MHLSVPSVLFSENEPENQRGKARGGMRFFEIRLHSGACVYAQLERPVYVAYFLRRSLGLPFLLELSFSWHRKRLSASVSDIMHLSDRIVSTSSLCGNKIQFQSETRVQSAFELFTFDPKLSGRTMTSRFLAAVVLLLATSASALR